MYKLFCAILGEGTDSFPIDIDETQTVGDLKKCINGALGSIDTRTLTLYKVDIDVSGDDDAAYRQTIEQIHRNTVTASKEPLNNPHNKLSAKFGQSIPAEGRIHILIKLPPGQSINPIDPSVYDAVAETVLTRPVYPSLIVYHSLQSLSYRPTSMSAVDLTEWAEHGRAKRT